MKENLEILVNSIPCVVTRMRYDNGLIIEYANEPLYELMQVSREEFLEKYENHYERIIVPKDWKKLQKCIEKAIINNEQIQMEYRVITGRRRQDYEWRSMQASILDEQKDGLILQCVITDITEAKQIQQELEMEREKLKAVIKMSGDMMFEYDIATDHMTYTNTGDDVLFFRQITKNYTKKLSDIVMEEDAEAGGNLAEALQGGRERFVIELRRKGTDEQYHWVSVTGKTLYDKEGKPEKVLGKVRNIDEQKKKEKELQEKSQKDSLTGLFNHMTAKNMAAKHIARMEQGDMAYLIVCDIDNFKKLNDTNGHMYGDAVICSFADEMSRLLPDAIKGRIGGDEFLIYVEKIERKVLEEQLKKLNSFMSEHFNDEKADLSVSCSIGGVAIDGSVRDYGALFKLADNALYMVKSEGKGSFLIVNSDAEGKLPQISYLKSERNKDTHTRKDTLIRTDEELVLFCVELLENVSNITSALKMICERTCKFFELDDMVCVEHMALEKTILYQWSRMDEKEYTKRMYQTGVYEWDRISERSDKRGALILREEQTDSMETEEGKSVLIVCSKEFHDYQGSIVYVDRRQDREWKREGETLMRISNLIFSRLRLLKNETLERQEMDRRLNYDALTGLPVYNRFALLAEQYIEQHSHEGLYCVYSDFSNFQYLNEVYGYGVGDRVLRDYAQALENEYDKGVLFCRVTSDHFLGLIRGNSTEEAWQSYWKFTRTFAHRINQYYDECNLVIATGFYALKETDSNVAAIMDNANEARKKCKEQRVNTAIFIYTDEVKKEVETTKAIVANMVSAYHNKEFHAYLQPKISLKTGKIVGAEALVRWIKPDGSIIMPGQFIDVSERNGFITKIDFMVLQCVMEYLQDAISKGEEVVPVSVNFSRRNNEVDNFVPNVVKWLDRYSVPRHLLEAELTESVFTADMDRLSANIEALREKGIEVSVDDFGTGYSSLNLLSRVSVDTIKIDKQFLDDTLNPAKGETALTITKYLIKMLKHLGFKVLAEGVETREQLEMLKMADCDLVQGYYYAKPMPIPEFRQFLKRFNQEGV